MKDVNKKVLTAVLVSPVVCCVVLVGAVVSGPSSGRALEPPNDATVVPYPEGYREWAHVKSALVSERHPDFTRSGGFRHIYANAEALTGYRTGTFPEGATIVVDWLEGRDDGGAFTEGARRQVDVM